jgi:hypothetical protein
MQIAYRDVGEVPAQPIRLRHDVPEDSLMELAEVAVNAGLGAREERATRQDIVTCLSSFVGLSGTVRVP